MDNETDAGDHYRPTSDGDESGVYRVVGTTGEITLLRLTDSDGNRVHSGYLCHCSRGTLDTEWEPTGNPDAGFSPRATVKNMISGLYWSFRQFF